MTIELINLPLERIRLETRIRSPRGHADHVKVFPPSDGKSVPRPERSPDGLA